jgi:hypothetical protein
MAEMGGGHEPTLQTDETTCRMRILPVRLRGHVFLVDLMN